MGFVRIIETLDGLIMKIAFITEGGKDFGMGHVFRSLTIARDLGSRVDVKFFTSSEKVVLSKIKEDGFKVESFATDQSLLKLLQSYRPDRIVFDCLDVDSNRTSEIKQSLKAEIIVFDNESESNADAGSVINALITQDFTNRKFIDNKTQTMYMLGPRYLILNRLFQGQGRNPIDQPNQARKILLAFGGSDPSNRTTFTLDRILQYAASFDEELDIDIVLGPHFDYEDKLSLVLEKATDQTKIRTHRNLANLFELINNTDLVITSPGLTMFEALSEKTHVIVMYQNELQERVYSDLFSKIGVDIAFFGLENSGFHIDPRNERVVSMQIGNGREEVLAAITGTNEDASISLRQVTDNDLKLIMEWRSNPSVYQYFYNQTKPLVWEEHLAWWKARRNRVDWIILLHNNNELIPVGSINCAELNSDSPEIGLFIGDTSQWGKAIGKTSVRLVALWLSKRGYERTIARVMKDNERSKRLFKSLGFVEYEESRPGELFYQKVLRLDR